MGQKTSPIGFRTGITLPWQSTWYAPKNEYGDFLVQDQKIRRFIDNRFNRQLPKGAIAKTEIIRTRSEVQVALHTARPGVVIGPRGGEVEQLQGQLQELVGRKVTVSVVEIKVPDLSAALVADSIAEQLCKRTSFRRTMKQYCESVMNAGAKGVKVICAGRLAGSEMARRETQKLGSIPLHTLDADVDYSVTTARTTYGSIGVKVWIYRGRFGEELDTPSRRRRVPRRAASRPPSRSTGGRTSQPPQPAAGGSSSGAGQ
jgi:small subunit ribosomal protein S3